MVTLFKRNLLNLGIFSLYYRLKWDFSSHKIAINHQNSISILMIDYQQIFVENICIHSTIWAWQPQLFQDIQQLNKKSKKGFPYIEFIMKGLILG
jgi:hypothetical protein